MMSPLLRKARAVGDGSAQDIGLRRNLDQVREGGHDILGLDGWAIEVKRYAEVLPADVERWWGQAVEQAKKITWKHVQPALAYRADRRPWRIVVPSDLLHEDLREDGWNYKFTIEMSPILFKAWVEAR